MVKLPRPKKVVLGSGVTLLYQGNPYSPTIAFGIWMTRGSRDEAAGERGLTHLLEHMVFRGTKSRNALRIALDLDAMGGQWDAYTGKETTSYSARVLEEHFETLVDVFSDILLDPIFPEETFRLERRVVQEEIRSIKDSPEEFAHELFVSTLFRGHSLGCPVAGYHSQLGRYSRSDLVAFYRKAYTSSNAVIGFVGNLPLKRIVRILDTKFRFRRTGGRVHREISLPRSGRVGARLRPDWSQTHVCIGTKTVPASHPDRYALALLSNVLGGGVSSRLFQSMREKTGLVYSVYSNSTLWRDTGALYSFFSVDPRNLEKALDIFHGEIRDLGKGNLDAHELDSAKAQLKASVVFGSESVINRLYSLFQSDYHLKRYVSIEEILSSLERVDRDEVVRVARAHLDEKSLTYTSCGPVSL
jgi:predicted Zn-dependent peptidase